MIIRLLIWIVFIYAIYHFIRSAIRSAVNKGIRDYEARKESERIKQKEVKVNRKNIDDAKYEDLK